MTDLASRKVLLVGVGGLGSPAAMALAGAGVGTIGLADDDEVEETNLHRQILFSASDVGTKKTTAAGRNLQTWARGGLTVVVHDTRILPVNAVDLVRGYDVVVEGTDNFATKFLVADACAIARVAVVHGAAVRWHGTALAVAAGGRPCYRCLFEDLPTEYSPGCSEAGVVGPAVGVVGAIQADLAISFLHGRAVQGTLVTFDGKARALRRRAIAPRPGCDLCGSGARIRAIDAGRYTAAIACAS